MAEDDPSKIRKFEQMPILEYYFLMNEKDKQAAAAAAANKR